MLNPTNKNEDVRKSIWNDHESAKESPEKEVQPQPQTMVDQLRFASKRQRNRDWEKELAHKTASFRGIHPELIHAIKGIANQHQVPVDDIARAFLEYALQCHQLGKLTIRPVLFHERMTLFPESGLWSTYRLSGWTERSWNTDGLGQPFSSRPLWKSENLKSWRFRVVSFRGLPLELVAAIRDLKLEYHVPIGEIVTLFLTHSLAAYKSGSLVLRPQLRDVPREDKNGAK